MTPRVSVEVSNAVAVVTVDNAPVNALDNQVLELLEGVAMALKHDTQVRAVVLTGAGRRAFLAGADVEEFGRELGQTEWLEQHTALTRRTLAAWETLPQPVVAAVQASAVGGGLELILVCDLIVLDPAARLGLPEVGLGVIPGAGGTQRLPRRIPLALATELLLLGRTIDAAEAYRIGLVNQVSAAGAAVEEAMELAARVASLPAVAVQAAKKALAAASLHDLATGLDVERALLFEVTASEDAREGFDAFLAKRSPRFEHR